MVAAICWSPLLEHYESVFKGANQMIGYIAPPVTDQVVKDNPIGVNAKKMAVCLPHRTIIQGIPGITPMKC